MKTYLTLSLLLVSIAVFNKQVSGILSTEKPVEKEISFAIAADHNYSATVYDNAMASVHVMVTKVSGTESSIVWDKTFDPQQLKNYPGQNNPLTGNIIIPGVHDNKDKLVVTYVITYDNKGSILQFADGIIVAKGETEGKLFINI